MNWEEGQRTILEYMHHDRRIGARHCGIHEIQRGFPRDRQGNVESCLKRLIKLGLVMVHPTSYGRQYSLNPRRIKEITEILVSSED